ncbi:MAG TPA: YbjN domain-containing protein [Gemmatimonadaceae bacterium]
MPEDARDLAVPPIPTAPPLTLREAVVAELEKGGLDPVLPEHSAWVTAGLVAGDAEVHLAIDSCDEREMVWAFGHLRGRVPADRRAAVAELLTHINYGTVGTSFDLDFSDGAVRIRGMLDGITPAEGRRIDRLVASIARGVERWYAAIMAVAFGDSDPAAACERELLVAASAGNR